MTKERQRLQLHVKFLILILLCFIPYQTNAFTTRAKLPPKTKEEDITAAAADAAATTAVVYNPSVPTKVGALLGSSILASVDGFVLKHFFNETERMELKHEKGNYKKTLIYGGKFFVVLSLYYTL